MKPRRRIYSLVQGPPEGVPLRTWRENSWALRHPTLNALGITAVLVLAFAALGWCLVASRPDLIESWLSQ